MGNDEKDFNGTCKTCPLPTRVRILEERFGRHADKLEDLKIEILGKHEYPGIKERLSNVEKYIKSIAEATAESMRVSKKAFNILIGIAVTIVTGVCVVIIASIFTALKGG